ncbi:symplekin isoform X1 [Apis mellifera carnica]|uniref:Symplekin isoform X1 n=2 Tax=Apis TaxID=7459 RepID=A0A7M7MQD3_APIME|nr:symplekin isoform X1 [Apis mellifera]KAG9435892.1 symplekin isoform X1 [Apis mellifera carnica]|eukprot:XP_026299444.1 symplekin isoform X1 [Apis mellifera]
MDPRIHRRSEPEKGPGDLIVEWLNEASLNPGEDIKVTNLCKVQEILINKEPQLLPLYLDEALQFSLDRYAEVRKTITGFIEEAGVKQPEVIPRVVQILLRLVSDESSAVAKRALRASGRILRAALKWISSATTVTAEMEVAWNQLSALKIQIINMIDSDNDGIRTQAVKFLEGVVLIQTYPDPDIPKKADDFSLEDIPLTLKIARRRKLEEEANDVMDLLIKFHGSPHVSSVNLMTCMGSLALIAKTRPQFMPGVIQALQRLQHDLPPTLSDSQVTSVQKQLKLTLLGLMKHPASIEFVSIIAKQLTQLGAKEQEILKAYPKPEDIRRMKKRQQVKEAAASSAAKRVKIETSLVSDESEIVPSLIPTSKLSELIELSESFIAERLSVEIATDLVMDSMAWVPDTMTAIFQREYQPTSTTDINIQRQTIAKLLATQIKQAKTKKKKDAKDEDAVMEDLVKNPTISVAEAKRERKREKDREKEKEARASLEAHEKSLAKTRTRLKALKLSEVTKPLSKEVKEKMLLMAVNRILLSEKTAVFGGVAAIRSKILTTLAATFNPYIKEAVLHYITDDMRNRLDLALGWLYEEYALLQGFQRRTTLCTKPQEAPHQAYNFLLCTLVSAIDLVQGKDRDTLLYRLYLEAPLITEDAVEALKMVSSDETRGLVPLQLLKEMVIRRPTKQLVFLNVLLCHTGHENNTIREAAIQLVCQLYSRPELSKLIEEYAVLYLGFLRLHIPPEIVFGQDRGRPQVESQWTESTTRACLGLYLALLSEHQDLIHELARVYTSMSADVKRIVLRLVEGPVRSLGMGSPQLLALVENCPKGAETLVTRIIHILTEKSAPSVELVSRVRELYQTRVSDVRFLIPVLNGLTKKEVIAALPKLIKLNPIVVKEVFNRLLGTHNNESGVPHTSPITPAELLIALHNIDPSKAELKTIIKATSLCFAEKQIYTQETVAVVMQHLMEMTPLPTLLMRTVIQSLALYPRLSGFVMNILQRLILKQVWKQPKVWEGFVKCCERTQPQSFAVILQLPPTQLAEALKMASNLRTPLLAHVEAFAENQKAHIPQSIMDVIQGKSPCDMHDEFDIAPPGDYPIEQKPDTIETDVSEPAPPGLD